jgi:hypothetical protein
MASSIYHIRALIQALEGKEGATEITQSPYLSYSDISTRLLYNYTHYTQCQQREER